VKAKLILWALLAVLAAAAVQRARGKAAEAERQLEAARAEQAGAIVAQQIAQEALDASLDREAGLTAQLDRVAQVAPKTTVREIVRWRSGEIEVAAETLCPEPGTTPQAQPAPIPIRFRIAGVEARLESQKGNLFAVGSVELWRTSPLPEEMLGRAPWKSGELLAPKVELGASLSRFAWGPRRPKHWRTGWFAGPAILSATDGRLTAGIALGWGLQF
jgi:hypothetical protein